jgi:DNA-binding PadR family transcriptional regulator
MKHSHKAIRAVRLLLKTDAIEAPGHSLEILEHLRENGLAEIYDTQNGDTLTRITDAGRAAVKDAKERKE